MERLIRAARSTATVSPPRQTIGPDVWRGASAQYALQAKHDVIGFYSSANNHPGFELSLANTSTNLSGHNFGGNFGVDRCLFNYWRPVADLIATQVDAPDLATLVDEDQELYQPQTRLNNRQDQPVINP